MGEKMNETIYYKLHLQAQEAHNQGMIKLSTILNNVIKSSSESISSTINYSHNELTDEIHQDLWKIATKLLTYYDLTTIDAAKVDQVLLSLSSSIIDNLEKTLEVTEIAKGPFEPKLPGEK